MFGEDVALLAGDALFAEAIALVFREQRGEPARVLAAALELIRAAELGGPACAVRTVLILTGESGSVATALRRFAAELDVLAETVPGDATALDRVASSMLSADA